MFNQKLSNTKMRKLFDWAMTSALLIILPMTSCVTGISDVDEIDEEPVLAPVPTTDQLTVKSDKTLYILTDYQPNTAQVGKDCIIRHLLVRFSEKKIVTDEASVSGMQEGDYMLLYLEDAATADNAALRKAVRTFIKQGGIVMFAETPAVQIETLLNRGAEGSSMPVIPDDADEQKDLVHIYYSPSYCPTFYHAKFDNFRLEQAEYITDYWLGKVADKVITETGKWVQDAATYKTVQAEPHTKANPEANIDNMNKAIHMSVYGTYYFPNDYYAKADANLGCKTNNFDIYVDIWPMKVTDGQGNVCRYFYGEVTGTLSFQNACLDLQKGKDYAYIWKKGAYIYKVNEMWGHAYEWKISVDGPDASKVDVVQHSPSTSAQSGSSTEGISYNISGNISGGYQGDKPALMLSLGGGLNISRSFSTSWTDVTYEDHTLQYGKNYIGGKFKFHECEAKNHTGSKGNVNVILGAECARKSYQPNAAFLIRVNDDTSPVTLNFTYWVDMISYRARSDYYLEGHMDTKGFLQSWDCPINLSNIKYGDQN